MCDPYIYLSICTRMCDPYVSIYPSIHLSIYPSIHLHTYVLSIYLSMSVYPSIHPSIHPSVHVCVTHIPIYPCLSIHASVCVSAYSHFPKGNLCTKMDNKKYIFCHPSNHTHAGLFPRQRSLLTTVLHLVTLQSRQARK